MPQSSHSKRIQRQRSSVKGATSLGRESRTIRGPWIHNEGQSTSIRPIPGVTILPLRLFLGVTFVYAGIQKLTDSGFFHSGSPTYIGHQLVAFSQGSPIAFLLQHFVEHAMLIGALTIVIEIIVGSLVLLGLLTRPAALVGMTLNLIFFLSASWHAYPYFLGSDIVFVICWLTLALTGPGTLALDTLVQEPLSVWLEGMLGSAHTVIIRRLIIGPLPLGAVTEPRAAAELEHEGYDHRGRYLLTRGEALIASAAAMMLILLGLIPRGRQLGGKLSSGSSSSASGSIPPGSGGVVGARYHKIGNVRQLPPNSAGMVSDPRSGDPVIIVHTGGSDFYAYDAVCTHAGCTVQYDPQQKLLICPCHGGAFDPTHGARVVAGPPPAPLSSIPMKIDSQGNIYIE
jgi:thiosulfate dehydrogenase [quinone] large subunit